MAALGGVGGVKHFGRAGPPAGQHCPRKPLCSSQLNCFQKPDVFKRKEGRESARDWKIGMVWEGRQQGLATSGDLLGEETSSP